MKPCVGTFIENEGYFHCQEINAWCYKHDDKWVIGPVLNGPKYNLYRIDINDSIIKVKTRLSRFYYGLVHHRLKYAAEVIIDQMFDSIES